MSSLEFLKDHFFAGAPRYRCLGTLGRGGMGVVYKAEDLDLDEVIAIKVLFAPMEFDEEALLARFKREVSLNRRIKHPNVARLHDFGTSGHHPYVTMEFIEGRDLSRVIEDEGPLPGPRAIALLRQIALGTHAAHEVGIIHRDLKPQNVMVTSEGAVAILDFGLARGKTSAGITLLGTTVGTPHYMSPEQARGKPTDARSDIYSIGVLAFEALTGRVLFDADSAMAIVLKHVEEPVPLDVLPRHGVPPALAEIVLKCLAKAPEERFQSASELESELALLGKRGSAPRVAVGDVEASAPAAVPAAATPAPDAAPEAPASERERPRHGAPAAPPREGRDSAAMPSDLLFVEHTEPKSEAGAVEPPRGAEPVRSAPAPAATGSGATAAPAPAHPRPPTPTGRADAVTRPRLGMPRETAEPKTRPPLVLVVDDEPSVRRLVANVLASTGCEILEAVNGQSALEKLHETVVDLVVMDVQMPLLDGFDTARILKSQPRFEDMPIVFMSGHLERNRLAFGLQAGATDFLEKPIDLESLKEKVWRILRRWGFKQGTGPPRGRASTPSPFDSGSPSP